MVNLISNLRAAYDVVLIDTPPLLPVTDAAVLAPRADGVLLLVRQGSTTVQDVKAAKDALHAVSGRILGSVLTMARLSGKQARNRAGRRTGWRPRTAAYPAAPGAPGSTPAPPTARASTAVATAGQGVRREPGMPGQVPQDGVKPSPVPRGAESAQPSDQAFDGERRPLIR